MSDVEGRFNNSVRFTLVGVVLAMAFCSISRADPLQLTPRVTLQAHEDEVLAVAFSPDGQYLATGGRDEQLLLWNLKTNRYTRAFNHDAAINQIRWAPTGKLLSIRGPGDAPILIDPAKPVAQQLPDSARLTGAKDFAFTRDGASVLVGVDRSFTDPDKTPENDDILVCSVLNKQLSREFKTGQAVEGLDATLDGKTIACQGEVPLTNSICQIVVNLFDASTGKLIQTIEGETRNKSWFQGMLRFSPDGKSLLYRKSDRQFAVWDLAAKKDRVKFAAADQLTYVGCSPAGFFVAGAQGDKVLVWDARTAELLYVLSGAGAKIESVDISSGARLVAAAAGNAVCLWALPIANASDNQLPPTFQPPETGVVTAPDGRPLAVALNTRVETRQASEDEPGGSATVASVRQIGRTGGLQEDLNAQSQKLDASEVRPYAALRGRGKSVLAATFSSDGRTLVTAQAQTPVRMWDVASGRLKPCADVIQNVRQLAVATDGHTIAAVSTDGRLLLEDLADNRCRPVNGAEKNSALLVGGNTGEFLCGHWDGSVSFWKLGSVEDGKADKLVRELKGGGRILRLAMSADGSLLAASGLSRAPAREGDGTLAPALEVTVWNLKTGEVLASATGGRYEFVPSVGFADNGKTLLYRQNAQEIVAWGMEGPKRMQMTSLPASVRLAAFSPDGTCIATLAAQDERHEQRAAVHISDITTGQLLWELTGIAPADTVRCVGFSPDGKTVVANSGKVTLLWSLPEKPVRSKAH